MTFLAVDQGYVFNDEYPFIHSTASYGERAKFDTDALKNYSVGAGNAAILMSSNGEICATDLGSQSQFIGESKTFTGDKLYIFLPVNRGALGGSGYGSAGIVVDLYPAEA